MPKLRNATTDVGMFVQWMARKCRNHHPLEEIGLSNRNSLPDQHKVFANDADVRVRTDREDVFVYMAAGRSFIVTVKEAVNDEEIADMPLIAAGY